MRNLIAMYHFVTDSGEPRSFSTANFRAQLEALARVAEPVTLLDLIDKRPSGPTFSVTFDDGLKDGRTPCLEILESLKIKASFFVSTAVWDERKVLQTQKRQLLLRKLGAAGLAEAFNAGVDPLFRAAAGDVPKSHYDDALSTALKFVMDRMDWAESQRAIGALFGAHFDEDAEFERLYLSPDDAREMAGLGHDIGLHGSSHRRLAELYFEDQKQDLERCVETYRRVLGAAPRTLSYPFGSYNLFTLRLAERFGVRAGVTTIKRYNTGVERPLELLRYDCIDLPPAKTSLPDGGFAGPN